MDNHDYFKAVACKYKSSFSFLKFIAGMKIPWLIAALCHLLPALRYIPQNLL